MLIDPVPIDGPIGGDLLIICIETVEMVSPVTREHGQHTIVLDLHVAPLIRIPAIPNGCPGIVENNVIRSACASTIIEKDVVRIGIGTGGDVNQWEIAWHRDAIRHGCRQWASSSGVGLGG